MSRFLLLIGFTVLATDYCFAQDAPDPTPMQCQLIRAAVARYGYAASRQHALETYGPEAVRTGDKCFKKDRGVVANAHATRGLAVQHSVGMRYER